MQRREHQVNSNSSTQRKVCLVELLITYESTEKSAVTGGSSTSPPGTLCSVDGSWVARMKRRLQSVEAKSTGAVRELASLRAQGDGNGFALRKLVWRSIRNSVPIQPLASGSCSLQCPATWCELKSWGMAAALRLGSSHPENGGFYEQSWCPVLYWCTNWVMAFQEKTAHSTWEWYFLVMSAKRWEAQEHRDEALGESEQ